MQRPDTQHIDEATEHANERVEPMTGRELVAILEEAGIVGMWADRTDITDSVEFARELRRRAQTRARDDDASA